MVFWGHIASFIAGLTGILSTKFLLVLQNEYRKLLLAL
jgi:hypothetical protein